MNDKHLAMLNMAADAILGNDDRQSAEQHQNELEQQQQDGEQTVIETYSNGDIEDVWFGLTIFNRNNLEERETVDFKTKAEREAYLAGVDNTAKMAGLDYGYEETTILKKRKEVNCIERNPISQKLSVQEQPKLPSTAPAFVGKPW